ncbi:MAG: PEGA domain-containing protein [Kiloniellaceae bacterium]
MNFFRALALGLAGLGLGGCSSIVLGTDQDIAINSNPPGASCILEREGVKVGELSSTPGKVTVSKTKHDITISCDKEGYQTATYINDSGWESGSGAAGIALDVILTLGISSAIDSATGADNKYESPVNITLLPNLPAT